MASLFDQYERAAQRSTAPLAQSVAVSEPIAPGFVTARLDDDTPIFNKQRINFDPPDPITHMCVCNSHLVMGMSTNILLCIDLDHPDSPTEVELAKSADDGIGSMFLDPSGCHLIVSMKSGDNYYLVYGAKKAKGLVKLKGHRIMSVGWNHLGGTDSSTDAVLLGTSKGVILEAKLTTAEDTHLFSAGVEQYVKQLHSFTTAVPVSGIEVGTMPSVSSGHTEYFILVTLGNRLFQFIGNIHSSPDPPIFHTIFARYTDVPEHFVELPGKVERSQLCVFYPKFRSAPRSFAWMTGTGIYCGSIDLSCGSGPHSVTADTKLIQYQRDEDERPGAPLSIVATEFHILVLFTDRIKVLCSLNEQIIYNDLFTDRFGSLLGLCRDPVKETIWAFTPKAVFKYRVVRETRNVWQIYLDQNQFSLAKQYCQDNRANLNKVLTKEAEGLFASKNYMHSAKIYAETQTSFEEVALKFIALEDKDALKQFLMHKLNTLKSSEKMQITMIVAWLAEIWLNQLGQLKERGEETSSRYDSIQDEFRKFLATSRIKDCISENRSTIYDLIASHGDIEDMIFFAVLIQDFERVISHHIQQNNYTGALDLMSKQMNKELFYKFSPLLMQHVPCETVNAWIAKRDQLDPRLLIPALVQYDDQRYRKQGNEAIRYLEFCTQKLHVKDEAIHNYLLSLYAKLKSDSLMKYLLMQGQVITLSLCVCVYWYMWDLVLSLCSMQYHYDSRCITSTNSSLFSQVQSACPSIIGFVHFILYFYSQFSAPQLK